MKKAFLILLPIFILWSSFGGCSADTPQPPEKRIPMLLSYSDFDVMTNYTDMEIETAYCLWDISNGGFAETSVWYKQHKQNFMDVGTIYWAGNSYVADYQPAEVVNPDVNFNQLQDFIATFGNVVCTGSNIAWLVDEDGAYTSVPIEPVPDEIQVDYLQCVDPIYVWCENNNVLVVYLDYHSDTADANIIYAKYPVSDQNDIQWHIQYIPVDYALGCQSSNYTYLNGKLYVGALNSLLVIDVSSNEMSIIASDDLFSKANEYYPDQQLDSEDPMIKAVGLHGCWQDILILATNIYTTDDQHHIMYAAYQNDTIIGYLEYTEYGSFIFYDENMNVLSRDDTYKSLLYTFGIKFPRED